MLKAPDIPSIWLKRRLSVTWKRSVSSRRPNSSRKWLSRFWQGSGRISLTGRRWHDVDNAERRVNPGKFTNDRYKNTLKGVYCLEVLVAGPDLNRRPSGYEPDELPAAPPAAPYCFYFIKFDWLRGPDLNRRPSGYEPDELPAAPPRVTVLLILHQILIGCGAGFEPTTFGL